MKQNEAISLCEASKQALEALEDLRDEQNGAPLWKRQEHWQAAMDKANTAIPTLRTAIEQAEKQEPVAWGMILPTTGEIYDCISKRHHDEFEGAYTVPLYTTPPAARVQEPVAQDIQEKCRIEVVPAKGGLLPAAPVQYQLSPTDIYDFAGWLTTRKGVMKVGSSCEAGPMAEAVGEYLKTFPDRFTAAQRPVAEPHKWVHATPWRGLTDEEILEAAGIDGADTWLFKTAYAIEAKLREKNGGGE